MLNILTYRTQMQTSTENYISRLLAIEMKFLWLWVMIWWLWKWRCRISSYERDRRQSEKRYANEKRKKSNQTYKGGTCGRKIKNREGFVRNDSSRWNFQCGIVVMMKRLNCLCFYLSVYVQVFSTCKASCYGPDYGVWRDIILPVIYILQQ